EELPSFNPRPVVNNKIAEWDTRNFTAGNYILKISAKDRAGNENVVEKMLDLYPDFAVSAEGIKITNADGLEIPADKISSGSRLMANAVILNSGWKEGSNVLVELFDSANLVNSTRTTVSAKGSVKVKIPWNTINDSQLTIHELSIVVNRLNEIIELDTTNNQAQRLVNLLPSDTTPPQSPSGLTGVINSLKTVGLNWNANSEPDFAGYNVYRQYHDNPAVRLNAQEISRLATARSSDAWSRAYNGMKIIDGNEGTYWMSIEYPYEYWEFEECFVGLDFPEVQNIGRIDIDWLNYEDAGKDFEIKTWNESDWVPQKTVEGNLDMFNTYFFNPTVITDKIKITIKRGLNRKYVGIREVRIYSGNSADLISSASYSDINIDKLPYKYFVTAVDWAGNESAPSEIVEFHDNVPPVVEITSPGAGERFGGRVEIFGIVEDLFLQGYTVEMAEGEWDTSQVPPQGWTQVWVSAKPVRDDLICVINAIPGIDNKKYTVRVKAVDMGEIENTRTTAKNRTFVIDTTPPGIPQGVELAQKARDRIELKWQAEPYDSLLGGQAGQSSDLQGYYVFRNGERQNLIDIAWQGTAGADSYFQVLSDTSQVTSQEQDSSLVYSPDRAIDNDISTYWRPDVEDTTGTGNMQWFLEESFNEEKSLSGIKITWGEAFIGKDFRIKTWDSTANIWITQKEIINCQLPIVNCQFQNEIKTNRLKIEIAKAGVIIPENYKNADTSKVVDAIAPYPTIAEVSVYEKKDGVMGLQTVQGLIKGQTYRESDIPEGEYIWTVTAVDDLGNESQPSNGMVMDLRAPRVEILSPKPMDKLSKSVVLFGTAEDKYLAEYIVEMGKGDDPWEWTTIFSSITPVSNGILAVYYPTDLEGTYTFKVTAVDQEGYVTSRQVTVDIDCLPPAIPSNISFKMLNDAVELNWNGNFEADFAGYNIYRNGLPLNIKEIASLSPWTEAKSSWIGTLSSNVIDGNKYTCWAPRLFETSSWWNEQFTQDYTINKVEIFWAGNGWCWARDFEVQVWNSLSGNWMTVKHVEDNRTNYNSLEFEPVTTNALRIYINKGPSSLLAGAISEVYIYRAGTFGLIPEAKYQDKEFINVEYSYRITSVDKMGNESPKSDEVWYDSHAPRVEITQPSDGYFVSGKRLYIKGAISDRTLKEWILEAGEGEEPLFWQTIAS
ncbi:MAG: discoidin domain-containing protein, partial [Nitrospirota bacterium]